MIEQNPPPPPPRNSNPYRTEVLRAKIGHAIAVDTSTKSQQAREAAYSVGIRPMCRYFKEPNGHICYRVYLMEIKDPAKYERAQKRLAEDDASKAALESLNESAGA